MTAAVLGIGLETKPLVGVRRQPRATAISSLPAAAAAISAGLGLVRDMRNRFLVAVAFAIPIAIWSELGDRIFGGAPPTPLRDANRRLGVPGVSAYKRNSLVAGVLAFGNLRNMTCQSRRDALSSRQMFTRIFMPTFREPLHRGPLVSEKSPLGADNSDGVVARRGVFTEARWG